MHRIWKYLSRRCSPAEQMRIERAIAKIVAGSLEGFDLKKLDGRENQFRVRIGRHRIIFERKNNLNFILEVRRRDENTY